MERFENKYILSHSQYHKLRDQVALIGSQDSHNQNAQKYPVLSLYFDSEDLKFYHQKIDGEYHHIKVRKRDYNTYLSSTTRLEAKVKYNNRQIKVRLDPHSQHTEGHDYIAQIAASSPLYPTCHVYYEREAYEIHGLHDFIRINFDHNILALPAHHKRVEPQDLYNRHLKTDGSVLTEIKSYCPLYPNFLQKMLEELDLRKVNFSKYAWALATMLEDKGVGLGLE